MSKHASSRGEDDMYTQNPHSNIGGVQDNLSNDSEDISDSSSFFIESENGLYTLLMWIDLSASEEECETPISKDVSPAGTKCSGQVPKDPEIENNVSNFAIKKYILNKKLIIVTIVVLLCAAPLTLSVYTSVSSDPHNITKMSNPDLITDVCFEGRASISQEGYGDNLYYIFRYLGGNDGCSWFIYSNEDPSYEISNGGLVKRDYQNLGTGPLLKVSGDVLHIGSYGIKLVTEDCIYVDTIIIDGDISHEYSWNFIGEGGTSVDNIIRIRYTFIEYYEYATNNEIGRSTSSKVADFAVIDEFGIMDQLVSALETEYIKHYYPPDRDWYLNYLLSFVQICIRYPDWSEQPDLYLYGQYEYFAYPVETIFNGMGDCEDTSILLSAIYCGAGYNAAVILVYANGSGGKIIGHSTSAVDLIKLVTDYNVSSGNFKSAYMSKNNITYYFCETTVNHQLAAGYINEKYLEDIQDIGKNFNVIYPVTVNG